MLSKPLQILVTPFVWIASCANQKWSACRSIAFVGVKACYQLAEGVVHNSAYQIIASLLPEAVVASFLLRSGDVELNPGPGKLSTNIIQHGTYHNIIVDYHSSGAA